MPKFSGTKRRPLRANLTAPIAPRGSARVTHEGGEAFARDPESELFLLAATNMVGEDTFYERADERDARFAELVHAVTATNPAFIAGADVGLRQGRSGAVPARHDAHAVGRRRDGGRVRRRGRPRWPFGRGARPCSAPTSRPSCSATG